MKYFLIFFFSQYALGTKYQAINRHIVEFFQIHLKCCGLENGEKDFLMQDFAIPNSCSYRYKAPDTGQIITESYGDKGCISELEKMFTKYINVPFYVLPVLATLQLVGIITGYENLFLKIFSTMKI